MVSITLLDQQKPSKTSHRHPCRVGLAHVTGCLAVGATHCKPGRERGHITYTPVARGEATAPHGSQREVGVQPEAWGICLNEGHT
jgi:hypothetical protein